MKKLFASKQETHYDSFIGKHFIVGDLTLHVEDVIAEGGFSYVFLVRDPVKNKIYALKRMLVNSQTDLDNCKQEISIMKQFHRHPAIVPLRGHHTKHTGNGIYEVLVLMAHCPNGTVVDKMNDNLSTGFTEKQVVEIFSGIVDAVSLLHQHQYCHRDLKVENILIGPNQEYMLCDFGSAIKGELDPETDGHTVVEENINKFTTLAYRAPEMCDMYSGYKIGAPADNWALGVLLYKLCFFTTPFEENSLAIARAKYNIPSSPSYSDRLISVIRDTLRPNPADRLTAKEITARLKGEDVSRCPVQLPSIPSTPSSAQPSTPGSVNPPTPGSVNPSTPGSVPSPTRCTSPAPTRVQQSSEEGAIRSRQRPRGCKPQPLDTAMIARPPAVRDARPPSIARADIILPPARADIILPPARDPAIARPASTSREPGIARPASIVRESARVPAPDQSRDTSRDTEHVATRAPQSLTIRTISCEGGEAERSKRTPQTSGSRRVQSTTSPLVFLPPPPSSPSHSTMRRSRGHSRAKSDTTFLKNIGSTANPFLDSTSLSSSTGHLTGGSSVEVLNRLQSSGSESNFGGSVDWSSNPFSSQATAEDEFLKLSLRDNQQADEGKVVQRTSTNKIARSQIRSLGHVPLSSNALPLSASQVGSVNEEPRPSTLNLKTRDRSRDSTSPNGGSSTPLSHGSRDTITGSRDTITGSRDTILSPSSSKKKKKSGLFSKKKIKSVDHEKKKDRDYSISIVSNPLHDALNG